MEFNEFEPRFKYAKTRFKLNAGLNLETFDTMEPTIFKPRLKFKPPLKFFKFGHWRSKLDHKSKLENNTISETLPGVKF